MLSNKLAFTVLGAACLIAAGAGGYLALRQNAASPVQLAARTPTGQSLVAQSGPAIQKAEAVATPPPKRPVSGPISARSATTPVASRREAKSARVQDARTEPPAAVEHNWPGTGGPTSAPAAVLPPETAAPQAARPLESVERVPQEPTLLPEPPQKSYEELVVSADSVIGLQSETTVSSDQARVEDRVEARVTRDVRVGGRTAIPAGSRAIGTVTQVERGGKFKEHGRIAIRFQTVVLSDGTRLPISTDAVIREGSSPGNDTAKKIGGGAVAGTILGAIIGGAKGAAIGGMVGAGAGTGVVAAGDPSVATLHAGDPMNVRLLSPVTVVTER
jgi:hypothetical protein